MLIDWELMLIAPYSPPAQKKSQSLIHQFLGKYIGVKGKL